jgi:hypothetical protein
MTDKIVNFHISLFTLGSYIGAGEKILWSWTQTDQQTTAPKKYIRINKFEEGKTKRHVAFMLEEKYKVLEGNI